MTSFETANWAQAGPSAKSNAATIDPQEHLRTARHFLNQADYPAFRQYAWENLLLAWHALRAEAERADQKFIDQEIAAAKSPYSEDALFRVLVAVEAVKKRTTILDAIPILRLVKFAAFSKSIALILILGLLFFGFLRNYRGQSLNLWSQRRSVMDVQITDYKQDYGGLKINKTVESTPIFVGGMYYPNAIGTHANSRISITLSKTGKALNGACAYPDSVSGAAITCSILHKGQAIWRSHVLYHGNRIESFKVATNGAKDFTLAVQSHKKNIDGAHAVWLELRVL